eukprot:7322655-Prymnesium_polylepis.1
MTAQYGGGSPTWSASIYWLLLLNTVQQVYTYTVCTVDTHVPQLPPPAHLVCAGQGARGGPACRGGARRILLMSSHRHVPRARGTAGRA